MLTKQGSQMAHATSSHISGRAMAKPPEPSSKCVSSASRLGLSDVCVQFRIAVVMKELAFDNKIVIRITGRPGRPELAQCF
jgi:hypothetical protein